MVKTRPLDAVYRTRRDYVRSGADDEESEDVKGGGRLLASAIACAYGEADASGERSAALVSDLGARRSIERELANSIRKARERRRKRLRNDKSTRHVARESRGDRSWCIGDAGDADEGAILAAVNVDGSDVDMETEAQPPSRDSMRGADRTVSAPQQSPSSSSAASSSLAASSSFVRCSGNVVVFDETGKAVESTDYLNAQNLVEENAL